MHFISIITLIISIYFVSSVDNRDGEKNEAFIQWFKANGGELGKVGISTFEGMGRGFIAKEDIKEDDFLMKIPGNLIFSKKNLKSKGYKSIEKAVTDMKEEKALIAWLLWERNNENSFFKPYLDILPIYVPSVIYFSESELIDTQNYELRNEALRMQEDIQGDYKYFLLTVESVWPTVSDDVSLKDYKWAATMLSSRGLRFNGEIYMAPMADIFNYEPHLDERTARSGEFFLQHHVLDEKNGITIYSDRNTKKDAQLYEDYGDNIDEIYLKYHGFFSENNPFRCVKIDIGRLSPSQLFDDKKKDLLKALDFNWVPYVCMDKSGEVDKSFEVFTSILAFNNEETEKCLKVATENKGQWGKVFEECEFQKIGKFLKEVAKIPRKSLNNGDFEDENELKAEILEDRSLLKLRWVIQRCYEKFEFNTTIAEDRGLLSTLNEKVKEIGKPKKKPKNKNSIIGIDDEIKINPDQEIGYLHSQIAVNYRIHIKYHWAKICELYNINCMNCGYQMKKSIKKTKSDKSTTKVESEIKKEMNEKGDSLVEVEVPVTEDVEVEVPVESLSFAEKIDRFNEWFFSKNPKPSLIKAEHMPKTFRVGTIVTEDINIEETYLGVPTDIIMDSVKASTDVTSSVYSLISSLTEKYNRRDDFHELLFFLLVEKFKLKEKSKFWPYLDILPTLDDLDVPLEWSETDLQSRLFPSHLLDLIKDYQSKTRRKFESLLKIDIISDFFTNLVSNKADKSIFTWDNYLWATVILDSRSIWWEGKRHLVPMLDLINCKEDPLSPTRVHSTNLDVINTNGIEESFAITKSGSKYKKGDQLFENYGQPNHIYFTYHGFVLDETVGGNVHDCVHLDFHLNKKDLEGIQWDKASTTLAKRMYLSQTEPSNTSACLGFPVMSKIWVYYALKTNSVSSLAKMDQIGRPFRAGCTALLKFIDERLNLYDIEPSGHEASEKFLKTEIATLKLVKSEILQDKNYCNEFTFDDNEEEL